jgi:hypothetical protein
MISTALSGFLTIGSLVAVVVFACIASIFVKRSLARPAVAIGEEVGAAPSVLKKLRKREPLSDDEVAIATQVIAKRRSLMAYSIPAAIFSVGCFYVFGSLVALHGGTPSERTFLGVIPMFTALNVTIQLLRSASLAKRLPSRPRRRLRATDR